MNSVFSPVPAASGLRGRLAVTLLLTLLQRTPAVRLVQAAGDIVARSPLGTLLKSAAGYWAALGTVHSLAGATALVASQPSPLSLAEGRAITPVAFTVTDTINLGSWRLGGNLPPGLRLTASQGGSELTGPGVLDATMPSDGDSDDPYEAPSGGGNTMTTPVLVGTPTQAGNYTFTLQAYQLGGLTGFNTVPFSYTVNVTPSSTPPTNSAPSFTTSPAPQTVTAGATVVLSAAATGTPAPTYQWHKAGVPIPGATSANLTLTNVQTIDAGSYTVVATNAVGNVTSSAAALAVNTPSGGSTPTIARQPQPQTVALGSTAVFVAEGTGGGLSYQWRRNGANIAGANRATLVITGATAADAGTYSATATNSAGTATSSGATLAVVNERNFGHLVNLSIRTFITANEPSFTVGTVVGVPGGAATGTKPLLIRAVGPSLLALGVDTAISDTRLEINAGGTVVASNDNWNGDAALMNAFSSVGAFGFASGSSRDAAVFNPAFPVTGYTIQVYGVGGATGEVIAELYDATSSDTFSSSTPRLVNVSVRKDIESGASLTAGFVVGGNTSRTVLVRAIGPGLAALGVEGALIDPQLTLFNAAAEKIAENNDWGGDPQLTAAGNSVGAFAIANGSSRDAMLLLTLTPGNYTATVSGAPGDPTGNTVVEIYEVP